MSLYSNFNAVASKLELVISLTWKDTGKFDRGVDEARKRKRNSEDGVKDRKNNVYPLPFYAGNGKYTNKIVRYWERQSK